jgi:hypothetical protein
MPNPSLNADVPHTGLRPRTGRRLPWFVRRHQPAQSAPPQQLARLSVVHSPNVACRMCKNGHRAFQVGGIYGSADLSEVWNPISNKRGLG